MHITDDNQTLLNHIALLELDERADFSNKILEPCSSFFINCGNHYTLKSVGTINDASLDYSTQHEIEFRESNNCDFDWEMPSQHFYNEQFCNSDLEKIKLSGTNYGTALFATNQNDKAVCMYGLAVGDDGSKSEYGRTHFVRLNKLKNWLDQFLTDYYQK